MTKLPLIALALLSVLAPHSFPLRAETPAGATKNTVLPDDEQLQLFLLIGQSNMAGRGKLAEQDRTPHPRVWVLNQQDAWAPAVDPLHFDKPKMAGVGIGLTFGKVVADANEGVTVGLIPCAVGGSSVEQWKKGGTFYEEAVRRTKLASKRGKLAGILWHQGESNSAPERRAGYAERLERVVNDLRADLDAKEVPFVLGELGHFRTDKPGTPEMNALINAFAASHDNTACVDASGLASTGDNTHFDADSLREFGRRYAAAYLKLAGRPVLPAAAAPATESPAAPPKPSAATPAGPASRAAGGPDLTVGRKKTGKNGGRFAELHAQFVARASQGDVDVVFLGDSITQGWQKAPDLWKARYEPLKAANFGIGGDGVQHVLWRVENGELDGLRPKVIVLMIGTNNSRTSEAGQLARGIEHLVGVMGKKCPESKILLLAIFPRGKTPDPRQPAVIAAVNTQIAQLDDGKRIRFLDIGKHFLDADGKVRADLMPDKLHPNAAGYEVWADAMQPSLDEMLKQ